MELHSKIHRTKKIQASAPQVQPSSPGTGSCSKRRGEIYGRRVVLVFKGGPNPFKICQHGSIRSPFFLHHLFWAHMGLSVLLFFCIILFGPHGSILSPFFSFFLLFNFVFLLGAPKMVGFRMKDTPKQGLSRRKRTKHRFPGGFPLTPSTRTCTEPQKGEYYCGRTKSLTT